MQFELIDQTENSIKIGIKDADTTLITPIIEALDGNKKVKIVRYIETHPELDMPALYVEMYEGDIADIGVGGLVEMPTRAWRRGRTRSGGKRLCARLCACGAHHECRLLVADGGHGTFKYSKIPRIASRAKSRSSGSTIFGRFRPLYTND